MPRQMLFGDIFITRWWKNFRRKYTDAMMRVSRIIITIFVPLRDTHRGVLFTDTNQG
jgi:hypothetical protein